MAAAKIAADTIAAVPEDQLVAGLPDTSVNTQVPGQYSVFFKGLFGEDNSSQIVLNSDRTGTMTTPIGVVELYDVVYQDADFEYKMNMETPLGDMELSYEGTVDGNTISGRMITSLGTRPFSGTRE